MLTKYFNFLNKSIKSNNIKAAINFNNCLLNNLVNRSIGLSDQTGGNNNSDLVKPILNTRVQIQQSINATNTSLNELKQFIENLDKKNGDINIYQLYSQLE